MPSTVHIATELPVDADRVWTALLDPETFRYVCRGLFGFPALAGRTEPFHAGEQGSGWLLLFHAVPLHRHTIRVVELDPATRTMRTEEHGGVLRAWNHTLHVQPVSPRSCRYSDTVDIDAGPLTALVARAAVLIYRYRHRRWHRLVARHLAAAGWTDREA